MPISGVCKVTITLDGEPIKIYTGATGDNLKSRSYDGINAYSSPSFCNIDNQEMLTVVHNDFHAASSTVAEVDTLATATSGEESGFTIVSRDKFGNLRTGNGKNVDTNGASDVFSVALSGPGGYEVQTSSAVQNIINSDNTVSGYFRLKFGNATSLELPNHLSASAMQVALMTLYDP